MYTCSVKPYVPWMGSVCVSCIFQKGHLWSKVTGLEICDFIPRCIWFEIIGRTKWLVMCASSLGTGIWESHLSCVSASAKWDLIASLNSFPSHRPWVRQIQQPYKNSPALCSQSWFSLPGHCPVWDISVGEACLFRFTGGSLGFLLALQETSY